MAGSEVTGKAVGVSEQGNPFHKEIEKITTELGPFLVRKNQAYGDATRRIVTVLEAFYPGGIAHDQIQNAYYMIQILNKLSRIAENNDPLGEDPWLDCAGYSVLAHAKRELEKKKGTSNASR